MGIRLLHPQVLKLDISNSERVGMPFGRKYRDIITNTYYLCFIGRTLTRLKECFEQEENCPHSKFLLSYNVTQIDNLPVIRMLIPIDNELDSLLTTAKNVSSHGFFLNRQIGAIRHARFQVYAEKARRPVLQYLLKYYSNEDSPIWLANSGHTVSGRCGMRGYDVAYAYMVKRRLISNALLINIESSYYAKMPFREEPEKIFSYATLSELIAYPQ